MFTFTKKLFFYVDEVTMSQLVSFWFVSLVFGILNSGFNPQEMKALKYHNIVNSESFFSEGYSSFV